MKKEIKEKNNGMSKPIKHSSEKIYTFMILFTFLTSAIMMLFCSNLVIATYILVLSLLVIFIFALYILNDSKKLDILLEALSKLVQLVRRK